MKIRRLVHPACAVLATALATVAPPAAGNSVAMGADQIVRLGIDVGRPAQAANVELAAVPAEVVIPPSQQAAVASPVSGLVARLYVADGEPVAAGQRLAELSSAEFMALQREFLEAASAEELAASQLERDRGLLADGIIATRRMQETEAIARAARLRRDQATRELEIAGLAAADIEKLTASRELSPVLELRAPFDGFVIAHDAAVGDSIAALEPLVRIANLSQLWIEAHVPQEVAGRLQTGMRMQPTLQSVPIEATITTIGRVVDPATQTVLVRGTFDNSAAGLSAGQFLTVSLRATTATDDVYTVPGSAVTRTGDQTQIFVRDDQGFVLVPIEVLAENQDVSFIRGAIDGSSLVAVDGVSALKSLWLSQQEEED